MFEAHFTNSYVLSLFVWYNVFSCCVQKGPNSFKRTQFNQFKTHYRHHSQYQRWPHYHRHLWLVRLISAVFQFTVRSLRCVGQNSSGLDKCNDIVKPVPQHPDFPIVKRSLISEHPGFLVWDGQTLCQHPLNTNKPLIKRGKEFTAASWCLSDKRML